VPLVAAFVAVLGGAGAGVAGPNAMLAGTIAYGSFHSQALRRTDHFAIYLPPGYASSTQRYPVVYFLHGLPAPENAYRGIVPIAQAIEAAGRQAIVVGAQGSLNDDTDPEWRNWGPGRNWETATGVELVRAIDSRYRTIASRSGRLLIGISAGGYGAKHLALLHLDEFSVVESWSGYFHPTDPTGTRPLELGSPARDLAADVHHLVSTLSSSLKATPTFIAFYVGRGDRRFYAENETLNQELSEAGIGHVFRAYPGGHDQRLWQRYAGPWLELALMHLAPAH
jgi:enterochelin esterase-like enzyme